MENTYAVGDSVRLLALPNWLTHDLPLEEQAQLRTCVGTIMQVQSIDPYGYLWLGFGRVADDVDSSHFTGHSFCVSPDCLEKPR
jgi:hypothetical protein